MGSAKYFPSIDLHSGYWQCCIAGEDILKTAFLMRYGLYGWVAMPMGLMNAPATFIQIMNNLFSDILDPGVVVFLDDILMYFHMVKEHFILLEKYWCAYVSIHYTVSLRSAASYTTVQCSLASISCLKACTSVI